MTERILKLFGIKSRSNSEGDSDIESQTKSQECVTVEKFGSLNNLKHKSRDKQSLVVNLLKTKHEKMKDQKSASDCNLTKGNQK